MGIFDGDYSDPASSMDYTVDPDAHARSNVTYASAGMHRDSPRLDGPGA